MDDCSPVRAGIVEDGGTRGGAFHGEMDRCRESYRAGLRHAVVCPNVTGRTKERIAQCKRARAGCLALVDKPPVARTCILRVLMTFFFGVTFVFVLLRLRLYIFVEAVALRSIVLRFAGDPIATRVCVCVCVPVCVCFFLFIGRCRFFQKFFVPLPISL